jgi:subtilisin family serine protease/subtilisin-like proprotein convertase family protein
METESGRSHDERIVLQRGNEALTLTRMSDRFTVRLISDCDERLPQLAQQLTHQLKIDAFQVLSSVQLIEFVVDPAQLGSKIQAARQLEAVAFASSVYQLEKSPDVPLYLTDQLTLQFRDGVSSDRMQAITAALGLQVIKLVPGAAKAFVFRITEPAEANPITLSNRLQSYPEVQLAEPNIAVPVQLCHPPRQPGYLQNARSVQNKPYGSPILLEAAWETTRGDRSVVVAVVDDAIDTIHPDLSGLGKIVAPRLHYELDAAIALTQLPDPEASMTARQLHGTTCARIAVAEAGSQGMMGVAPGCALMPISLDRVLDDQAIETIFEWASQQGADVICCSWRAKPLYFPLSLRQRMAIARAATQGRAGKGCVIVFAAGNEIFAPGKDGNHPSDKPSPVSPLNGFGLHPNVITVVATSPDIGVETFSPGESGVAIAAPYLQGTDALAGGTSGAAAAVSGVVALMLSANPNLTALEVKQILQETADKIGPPQTSAARTQLEQTQSEQPQPEQITPRYDAAGYSLEFGYGQVNASKAVSVAKQKKPRSLVARWLPLQNLQSVEIPDADPQGVLSVIAVQDDRPVVDIDIHVSIEHPFASDLEIYLLTPRGEVVLLESRTFGKVNPLHKNYSLDTTPRLECVLYQPARGDWQLQLIDLAPSDVGQLVNWTLNLGF